MNIVHKPDAPFSPINDPKYQHTPVECSVSVATEVVPPVPKRKRKRKGSFNYVLRGHVLRAAEAVAGLPGQELKITTTSELLIREPHATDAPVDCQLKYDERPTKKTYDREKLEQIIYNDEASPFSGEHSAVTMRRLQAFRYVPDPEPTMSRPQPEARRASDNMIDVDVSHLEEYFSDDDPETTEEDFELDEDVFAEFIDDDGTVQGTSEMTDADETTQREVIDLITPSPPTPPVPTPATSASTPAPPEPAVPTRSQRSNGLSALPTTPMAPFMRSHLPSPAPPSSVIPSLIPSRRIATCFRTAEVLRLLSPFPPGTMLHFELYACVVKSSRNTSTKIQDFTLADLFFPQRPPYLQAAYALWAGSRLFDHDSAAFLGGDGAGNKMCRAILQVVKGGGRGDALSPIRGNQGGMNLNQAKSTEFKMLSIWEATWDDVQYVKGIVEP